MSKKTKHILLTGLLLTLVIPALTTWFTAYDVGATVFVLVGTIGFMLMGMFLLMMVMGAIILVNIMEGKIK